jgi:hypothetical protein
MKPLLFGDTCLVDSTQSSYIYEASLFFGKKYKQLGLAIRWPVYELRDGGKTINNIETDCNVLTF